MKKYQEVKNFTLGGSFWQIPFFHLVTFHSCKKWNSPVPATDIFPVWTMPEALLPLLWFFIVAELEILDSFGTHILGIGDFFALWVMPKSIWLFLSLFLMVKLENCDNVDTKRSNPPLIDFKVFQVFWVSDVQSSPPCILVGDHHSVWKYLWCLILLVF